MPPLTCLAADGTIYLSDTDNKRILKIAPDGTISPLFDDPRLAWEDAIWIDDKGDLPLLAAQLNRTAGMKLGVDAVSPADHALPSARGASPAPNDHRRRYLSKRTTDMAR